MYKSFTNHVLFHLTTSHLNKKKKTVISDRVPSLMCNELTVKYLHIYANFYPSYLTQEHVNNTK